LDLQELNCFKEVTAEQVCSALARPHGCWREVAAEFKRFEPTCCCSSVYVPPTSCYLPCAPLQVVIQSLADAHEGLMFVRLAHPVLKGAVFPFPYNRWSSRAWLTRTRKLTRPSRRPCSTASPSTSACAATWRVGCIACNVAPAFLVAWCAVLHSKPVYICVCCNLAGGLPSLLAIS